MTTFLPVEFYADWCRSELARVRALLCPHRINRSRARCEPCDQADKPAPKELTTNA